MNRKKILISGAALILGATGVFLFRETIFRGIPYLNDIMTSGQAEEKIYIEAMTGDTYGGQTPEETVAMFIDALKKEDVELAAKYFILNEKGSRQHWFKTLLVFKEQGLLDEMAGDTNLSSVRMEYNKYSGVWKIADFR